MGGGVLHRRNAKLLADTPCREIWDLLVTWQRGAAVRDRVLQAVQYTAYRMLSTFTHESAAMLAQVPQQITPFHGATLWGT